MLPCSTESWLSSPRLVLHFSHFMAVLVLPLHVIGAWCIVRKTPPAMSSVKLTILNLHFWNASVDVLLNIFVIPCPLFPAVGGYFLGVLSLVGVSPGLQTWIITVAVSFVCVSTTLIFENRYHLLINKKSKWLLVRPFWKLSNCIFVFLYMIPTMTQMPDQDLAKQVALEALPCVPEFLLHVDMFILSLEDNIFIISSFVFTIVVFGQLVAFLSLITIKLSCGLGARLISESTRRLQKKLLKALMLQTSIPFLSLLLPTCIAVYAVHTDYFEQALNNAMIVIASFHGLVSTSSMILIHNPYRRAVVGWCWSKRVESNANQWIFSRNVGVEVSTAS